jgi:phenylalanyl-tRNA synthetase beta chain
VFDEFSGGTLAEGKKSLAISVCLQSKEATLTDVEIEAVAIKIIEKVTKVTGGVLRG